MSLKASPCDLASFCFSAPPGMTDQPNCRGWSGQLFDHHQQQQQQQCNSRQLGRHAWVAVAHLCGAAEVTRRVVGVRCPSLLVPRVVDLRLCSNVVEGHCRNVGAAARAPKVQAVEYVDKVVLMPASARRARPERRRASRPRASSRPATWHTREKKREVKEKSEKGKRELRQRRASSKEAASSMSE